MVVTISLSSSALHLPNARFDRRQQRVLICGFLVQRPHDLFVHGALHHQMVNDHRLLLPLPPQAGVGLFV